MLNVCENPRRKIWTDRKQRYSFNYIFLTTQLPISNSTRFFSLRFPVSGARVYLKYKCVQEQSEREYKRQLRGRQSEREREFTYMCQFTAASLWNCIQEHAYVHLCAYTYTYISASVPPSCSLPRRGYANSYEYASMTRDSPPSRWK